MEGNCTSGCRLAGSRERLRGGRDQREELGGGRGRNQLLGAAGHCPAAGRLHPGPPGGPNRCLGGPVPIKARTSPMSHTTAISPCILGAVAFKPASGGTSSGPPWAQRPVQVYWS